MIPQLGRLSACHLPRALSASSASATNENRRLRGSASGAGSGGALALADAPVQVTTTHQELAVAVEATTSVISANDRRAEARMKGYEGESCSECGNFTMVRNGTDKIRPQTIVNGLRTGNNWASSGQLIDHGHAGEFHLHGADRWRRKRDRSPVKTLLFEIHEQEPFQIRLAHLHNPNGDAAQCGLYACCPTGSGYHAEFDYLIAIW